MELSMILVDDDNDDVNEAVEQTKAEPKLDWTDINQNVEASLNSIIG